MHEDPKAGWKVSRFVPGCTAFDYHDQEQVAQALRMARRLHESGVVSPWSFDFYDESLKIEGLLREAGWTFPHDYDRLAASIAHLVEPLRAGTGEPVLCHNDFYGPNLLVHDGRMSLIDWEYAAMGDYGCDFGNFVAQGSGYTVEEAIGAIPLYFGRMPTKDEEFHLLACTALVGWYWYVWALYKELKGMPAGEWLYVWYKAAKEMCIRDRSVALARALAARGVEPAAVLGFSLGQASALAASGMLSCEATFAFVKERSRLMAEAAAAHPGAMSALLKADEAGVQALCDECAQGDVLVPANFNCPGQIVIAGTSAAVERAEAAWAASGKRFSRLATSGAFHSPLMAEAAEGLAAYLKDVAFEEARVPLVCNVDARPLAAADARDHLVRHLTSPVRFEQSVQALAAAGADTFAEVGFGGVLFGLVKRIDRGVGRACVQDRESLEAFCGAQASRREAASSVTRSEQELS